MGMNNGQLPQSQVPSQDTSQTAQMRAALRDKPC